MWVKRIFCVWGTLIIFAFISLFLVNGIVQGQCTPEYQYPDLGFWMSVDGKKVPYSLWPPQVQAQSGNYNYASVIPYIATDWCWDVGSTCATSDISGWDEYGTRYYFGCHQIGPFNITHPMYGYSWMCNHLHWTLFEYESGANRDYDCDGTFDPQDPNPGTPDASPTAENGIPGCNAQARSQD